MKITKPAAKKLLALTSAFALLGLYQNCANNYKVELSGAGTGNQADATATPVPIDATGSVTVSALHANPPLDLFFIVDNSGSMLGHQINLGNAFASVFQNNTANLSNFDVNIYVYSTASTVNPSYVTTVPTIQQSAVASVPAATDATNLIKIPGSIFGFSNTPVGVYGTAPYTEQFTPAAVLDLDSSSNTVTNVLHIAKKGTQTDSQYAASLQDLTQKFQSRLAYLNPTTQLAYEPLTDISSGLCSMARVLKHSSSVVQAGDSAAFILVSDDNDRLNVRNPNGNQCVESILGANEVIDGTCGHDATTFSYDSNATVTYQTDTKFNYQSGTQVAYSYPSGEACNFTYQNGYKYTSTYTAVRTQVTYTKCTQMADGTCISQAAGTAQILSGNYVSSNGSCSQDMSKLVTSPVVGSSFVCASSNLANQIGASGVDTAATASQCSSNTLAALTSDSNKTAIACTIIGANTASATLSNQVIGSCTNFCANHASQYPSCAYVSTSTATTKGSLSFPVDGVTCGSQCPDSKTCGNSTIGAYVTATYGAGATCGSAAATLSSLLVKTGVTSTGAALSCSSSLAGLTVTNSSGTAICSGKSTVQDCIASLQTGTATSACAVNGGDKATVTVPTGVTCSTTCANSNGYCSSAQYATVGAYLAQTKSGLCLSSANSGLKTFALTFTPAQAAGASCSSKCSDTLSGSCDGKGYGATDGSTVSQYIQSQLGGAATCASATSYVADTASIAVAAANVANACATTAASPVFKATDSAHPASTATNYVAGDANHLASDLQSYIAAQATAVFGANNPLAVAVITQLPGDNLQGTDVGTDYINLAKQMNSTQVTSILGNYSTSLGSISNFIVETTQNSYALPVPAADTVYSVEIQRAGSSTITALDSSAWSWSGQTLSLASSTQLQIGDQIVYQYHN